MNYSITNDSRAFISDMKNALDNIAIRQNTEQITAMNVELAHLENKIRINHNRITYLSGVCNKYTTDKKKTARDIHIWQIAVKSLSKRIDTVIKLIAQRDDVKAFIKTLQQQNVDIDATLCVDPPCAHPMYAKWSCKDCYMKNFSFKISCEICGKTR